MKKISSIFLALILSCFCSSFVFAFDLDDDNGGGPGATGIAVSVSSIVYYTGRTGAGGYTNGDSGEVMSCCSVSTKASPKECLTFAVRSSQHPNDTDDNGVYQRSNEGTAPTSAFVSGCLTEDFSTHAKWHLRGRGNT